MRYEHTYKQTLRSPHVQLIFVADVIFREKCRFFALAVLTIPPFRPIIVNTVAFPRHQFELRQIPYHQFQFQYHGFFNTLDNPITRPFAKTTHNSQQFLIHSLATSSFI